MAAHRSLFDRGHVQPQAPGLAPSRTRARSRRSARACAGSARRRPAHRPAPAAAPASSDCGSAGSWPITSRPMRCSRNRTQPAPIRAGAADDADNRCCPHARRSGTKRCGRASAAGAAASTSNSSWPLARVVSSATCTPAMAREIACSKRFTAQQERHQQRHQHITGTGHVHRQVRRGPAPDRLAADRQRDQLARVAADAVGQHPFRPARQQRLRSGDGIVLGQARHAGQATEFEGVGRHQPGMRQQALGEDLFQARLDVGAGVGVADHRVQAVTQLRRRRQHRVEPVGKGRAVADAAEVAGDQHPRALRQAALAGAQQQVGEPVRAGSTRPRVVA